MQFKLTLQRPDGGTPSSARWQDAMAVAEIKPGKGRARTIAAAVKSPSDWSRIPRGDR